MNLSWSTRFRYLMLGFLLVVVAGFLYYVRVVTGPLVVSALLAYVMNPVVQLVMRKLKLSKRASVAIVFFATLILLLATPALFLPFIIDETQTLATDIGVVLLDAQEYLSQEYTILGQIVRPEQFIPDFSQLLTDGFASITVDALHFIETTTKNLLWLLVILASMYSLLRDWDHLRDWLLGLAPASHREDVQRIYLEIKAIWRGYLRGNLALMGVTGIMFTLAWVIIGVPGAVVLGIIAGLLTIIPDLGPAIAAILAIAVALVEGSTYLGLSNFWFAVLVLGVYMVLINIKNIWIRPRIFGRSVHMHDGIVFVAIVAAVVIEGILGALIVIPLLASAGVIGRYIWRRILDENPFPAKASAIVIEEDAEFESED